MADNYYLCLPGDIRPSATPPACVPFMDRHTGKPAAADSDLYFDIKSAQAELMRMLADPKENPFASDDIAIEATVIRWLIGREIGYTFRVPEKDTLTLFTMAFKIMTDPVRLESYLRENQLTSLLHQVNPMVSRIRFWRAKLALILIQDIENPYSRKFLSQDFEGMAEPVFGVKIDPHKTSFSNTEKLQYLKEIYEKLIKNYGDPLLEAECLMAQYELRAADPAQTIAPSRDLEYLRGKIGKALADGQAFAQRGKTIQYIIRRIPPQGYNRKIKGYYWSGDEMRRRESYRYLAQSLRLQAQLNLFETKYHQPDFEKKMRDSLALLSQSQNLAEKYGDDPAKIKGALGELNAQTSLPSPRISKSYGDLLSIISTEQMKAAIHFQLGLHLQHKDPKDKTKSLAELNAAKMIAENLERILDQIMQNYAEYNATPANGITSQHLINNAYFWRSLLLGATRISQAGILLSRQENQNENLLIAQRLIVKALASAEPKDEVLQALWKKLSSETPEEKLDSAPPLWGEHLIRARIMLTDAILRTRSKTPDEEKGKIALAAKILQPLLDGLAGKDPYAVRLEGSIRLAEAKLKLAQYHLSETDESLVADSIRILDGLISRARPDGNFSPTPVKSPPEQLPNQGVFEDYELSFALQTRAEAYVTLTDFKKAKQDFENALSVYKDYKDKDDPDDDLPLNYFARIGLAEIAGWTEDYKTAEDTFSVVLKSYSLSVNDKMRIELGRDEAALRQQTLLLGTDATAQADKAIETAKKVITNSDELFLIERAYETLVEALMAKKECGTDELKKLLTSGFNLTKLKLHDRVKANLYLKIADGLFFIQDFKGARAALKNFETDFKGVMDGKPLFRARYGLIRAEIAERIIANAPKRSESDRRKQVKKIEAAARQIFADPKAKRDPYLLERVLRDIINLNINEERFEAALALILALRGQKPKEALEKLGGKLDSDLYAAAEKTAQEVLQSIDMGRIFREKGLRQKWDIFSADLLLRQAEILTWTKNYAQAAGVINDIDYGGMSEPQGPQGARLYIIVGNLAAYDRDHQDYPVAEKHYLKAEEILNELNDPCPSQEVILARAELYLNLAGVYAFDTTGKIRNFRTARLYFMGDKKTKFPGAIGFAKQIKGNADLKNRRLAEIYSGMAKVEQIEVNPAAAKRYLRKAIEALENVLLPPKELVDDITRMRQILFEPLIKVEQRASFDSVNGGEQTAQETQTSLVIQAPLNHDRIVPYFRHQIDTRRSSFDRSETAADFAGVKLRLLDDRMTIGAEGKIPGSSRIIGDDNSGLPKFYRRPDFAGSIYYGGPKWIASASASLDASDSRFNVYYAELMHRFGYLKNFNAGASASRYHFLNFGDFRRRTSLDGKLEFIYDPAQNFGAIDYGLLQLRLFGAFTAVQVEHNFQAAEYDEPADTFRFPLRGGAWRGGAGLRLNLGDYGLIDLSAEGAVQRTAAFDYRNGEVVLNYQVDENLVRRLYRAIFK